MDLLCDADEYKLIHNHIDVVYYNGNNPIEMKDTQQLVEENIKTLMMNDIPAESHPEYLDDLEKNLIKSYKPIINIKDNPYNMEVLSTLRHEALMWAKDL